MSERLINACKEGDISLVNQYISEGDNPSDFSIIWASINGHIDIVKLLLTDNRVDPSSNNNYAIKLTSLKGYLEVVKLLLTDNRVDPAAENNYAIKWASTNGHTDIVKLLLADNRVDPAAEDNYAIRFASDYGHIDIVKLLLQSEKFKFTNNLYYTHIIDMLAQIRQEKLNILLCQKD